MSYVGDIRLGDTIDIKFCTVTTTGAPTQLAGSPVISAYPGNSTTQLTAGITLSVDFDTVTGLNNVRVVATSGNGYATATNYTLVITTGTVGGTSVVGYVVGEFSVENRLPLSVGSVTGAVGSVTGLTASNLDATVSSRATPTNITAGTITTVTNLTNAPTAGDLTATMKTSIGTAVAASAVASVTGNLGGNVTGSVGSVATGGITAASFAADAITAAKIAADVTTELQSGLATSSALSTLQTSVTTIDDLLDTEVAAIKTVVDAVQVVTDKLNDTLEDSGGGAYIFTVASLAQAPSGTGASAVAIADEVQTRTIAAVTLVNGLAANTVTASALAADAVTEIQSGLATAAALATVDDFLDTEIAALTTAVADLPTNAELATALGTADDAVLAQVALVKAKTDSLTFTLAGKVDANTLALNGTTVIGAGTALDKWRA